MTLILSALTEDYVVQASDRRLTNARTTAIADEDANKAVVFCASFAVGYTGLSRIGGMATDIWITEVLRGANDANEGICALRDRATQDLTRTRGERRQAFVLAGWTPDDAGELHPCAVIVSNFFDPTTDGEWLAVARSEFTVSPCLFRSSEVPAVIDVPARLSRRQTARLTRTLRDLAARGLGPTAIGRVLEDTIRAVATTDRTVGTDVLVASVPRHASAKGDASWSAGLPTDPLSRTKIASYLSSADERIWISGPNVVCGGMATARPRVWQGDAPALTPEYIAQLAREFGIR